MDTPTDFMFTCDTFWPAAPLARRRALLRPVLWMLAPLLVLQMWLPWSAYVLPLLTVAWAGCVYRRGVPTVIAEFFREWRGRSGLFAPRSAVSSGAPWWVASVVAGLAGAVFLPLVSVCGTWALLLSWQAVARRRGAVAPHATDLFDLAEHVFLTHPDRSCHDAWSTGGLWLPQSTVKERVRRYRALAMPLLVPAAWIAGDGLVRSFESAGWSMELAAAVTRFAGGVSLVFAARRLMCVMVQPSLRSIVSAQTPVIPPQSSEWERAAYITSWSTYSEGEHALCDHVFLGYFPPAHTDRWHPLRTVPTNALPNRVPALVPLRLLRHNGHITGTTGSGKTSIAVAGLSTQLVRPRRALRGGTPGSVVGAASEGLPMLFIDMKGDEMLFNTVREECARAGRTFRYFTPVQGRSTSYFNALPQLASPTRHLVEFCELILNMLSLFHGLSYGRSYYSKQSRDLILTYLQSARPTPASWDELYQGLRRSVDPKKHADVFEIMSSVHALSCYPVLGPAPRGVGEVHMPTVIERCEVCYFWLPAQEAAMTVRDIAKMALYCFLTAAREWKAKHGERQSACFLDETQIIASRNFAELFQQCSGANLSLILTNQSRVDLDTVDTPHLSRVVGVNTVLKQAFTLVDPLEVRDWVSWSEDRLGHLYSKTDSSNGQGGSTSWTVHDVLAKALDQNLINQANSDRGGSVLHAISDGGFLRLCGNPRRVWTPFLTSESEYLRRKSLPWPTAPQPVAPAPGAAGRPATTVVNRVAPSAVEQNSQREFPELEAMFQRAAERSGRRRPVGEE